MGLAVAEDQAAFVEGLVACKGHFEVVSDSHQQNASLRKIHTRLSDNLIEKLVMQLFSDGANTTFPCLLLIELQVEDLLKIL